MATFPYSPLSSQRSIQGSIPHIPSMDLSFSLKPTPYGGRGLYATKPIPKDTLLVTCDAPHATVISRKFRKEVCSHCFAYAFDCNRNAWNIRYTAHEGSGVWFCTEECRDVWAVEQNVDGLQGLMNVAVDKLARSMKKPNSKADAYLPSVAESMQPEDITLEFHDLAWKRAEEVYAPSDYQTPYLDDMELDAVRFVVYGIIHRYLEDTLSLADRTSAKSLLLWQDLLKLQNNEVMYVRSRPYMLDSHIRIYGFLRKVLLPVLQVYVKSSDTVRAIIGRDQGNVFGLWDMSTKGDSEMLGWSMYVAGSYFNHGMWIWLYPSPWVADLMGPGQIAYQMSVRNAKSGSSVFILPEM